MNKHDDGGQAFPVQNGYEASTVQGMSLRDFFAAKAMPVHMHALSNADTGGEANWHALIARLAYETADAMLKERSK